MKKSRIAPWKVLKSQPLFQGRTQSFRSEEVELPDGTVMPAYYIMDFPDWVHTLPVTPTGDVILVEQYRHATGTVTYEFPGGSTHSRDEDPADAALRELREETGYTSSELVRAGRLSPNPAFQSNHIHTYVAFDCAPFGPQELDPYEIIDIVQIPLKELPGLIQEGRFEHALMVAGYQMAIPLLRSRFSDI